jgi:hypothetical protein
VFGEDEIKAMPAIHNRDSFWPSKTVNPDSKIARLVFSSLKRVKSEAEAKKKFQYKLKIAHFVAIENLCLKLSISSCLF